MKRPDGFYTDFAVFLREVRDDRRANGTLEEDWVSAAMSVVGAGAMGLAAARIGAGLLLPGLGLLGGPVGFAVALGAASAVAELAKRKRSGATRRGPEYFQQQIRRAARRFHELQPLLEDAPERAMAAIDELFRQLVEDEDVYA